MNGTPELSVVVPVYNEAESLRILWPELARALGGLDQSAEVIFVDDGSTDESAEVIRSLLASDERVRLIRFQANAGLSAAFHAGLRAARGGIVATLDSDLQNDPAEIANLLAYLAHCDAVIGWRQTREDPWLKRLSSRIANAVRNRLTDDRVHDSASSLRVMRRECFGAIPPYDGMHRFVPTLLTIAGYRVIEVPVRHRRRRFGRSKFGVRNRLRRTVADLLAVRWMMARRLRYSISEDVGGKR